MEDSTAHLCGICQKKFPECDGKPTFINNKANPTDDRIIKCPGFYMKVFTDIPKKEGDSHE